MATELANEPGRDYSIRSVERVCDILNLVGMSPEGVSLAEAAAAVNLPKSSTFRYLFTLEQRRYVERDPASGDYRLGTALLPLQAREIDRLIQRARPHLEQLRDELGETINLGRLDGYRVVYLEIIESHQTMRLAARRGDHDYLHSTALGKAIAATMPEARVREALRAEGMPRFTDRTITELDELMRELGRVRRRGYAIDDGENEPDARCVGVAIPGGAGDALSVSAPAARLPRDKVRDVAARLTEAARELGTQPAS